MEAEKFRLSESLTDPSKLLYSYIAEYYARDPQIQTCDPELLMARIERDIPKQKQLFQGLLDRITQDSVEISSINLFNEILNTKKEYLSRVLSSALLGQDKSQVPDLMEEWKVLETSLNELQDEEDVKKGLPIGGVLRPLSELACGQPNYPKYVVVGLFARTVFLYLAGRRLVSLCFVST